MLITDIFTLIEKISPHAKDYIIESEKQNQIQVLYTINDDSNQGCFLKVENSDSCIFYAIFINENYDTTTFDIIKENILIAISNSKSKEICFNVFGKNTKLIKLAKDIGFKTDMEGFHLEFCNENISLDLPKDLSFKTYEECMLEEFIKLFESAYYQLNLENGWSTDSYSKTKNKFNKYLLNLSIKNQVNSLWKNMDLLGAYIFEGNYITDIVIAPNHQRQGYGKILLNHCIFQMKKLNSDMIIRLRVAKSNIKAYNFYFKNGFNEISCFAEHTCEN